MVTHSCILAQTIPKTEEAGGLVCRVAKSQTRLKQFRMHVSSLQCNGLLISWPYHPWIKKTLHFKTEYIYNPIVLCSLCKNVAISPVTK